MRDRVYRLIRAYSWPAGVFAVTRVGLVILAYLSLILLPINADPNVYSRRSFPNNLLLDGWTRWDAGWYRGIAEHGYSDQPVNDQGQRNVVFFPLYPMAIRMLNLVIRNSYVSGLIISNLSFAAALVLLYLMVRERHGETTARWTIAVLATYPFSFYFSAMYTEALFLLLIVAAFYFGERERWAAAAACAAAASATRTFGVAVALGLCLLYLEKTGFKLRRIRWNALWLLMSPLGLMAYMAFLWYRFDAPFLFVTSHYVSGWVGKASSMRAAWATLVDSCAIPSLLTGAYPALDLLNLVTAMLVAGLLAMCWRRLGLPYAAWAGVHILGSFLAHWRGMGRFMMPAFPVFVGVAMLIRSKAALLVVLYLSVLLLALFTIMYTHLYWVT